MIRAAGIALVCLAALACGVALCAAGMPPTWGGAVIRALLRDYGDLAAAWLVAGGAFVAWLVLDR